MPLSMAPETQPNTAPLAELAFSCYGDPKLPALVLLHGFLGNKHDWLGYVEHLTDKLYCICIDLPGHGDSRDILIPSPGFDSCAQLIINTLAKQGIHQFHLQGYSLGGRIALHLAHMAPKTLLSLHLESCHPGLKNLDDKEARLAHDKLWADKLLTLPMAQFLQDWYQQAVFSDLSPNASAQLIERRLDNARQLQTSAQTSSPASAQVDTKASAPTETKAEAQIVRAPQGLHDCYCHTSLALQADLWHLPRLIPSFYYAGSQDAKFSALAQQWQARGGPQLHLIAAAGHNIHNAQPQALAARLAANICQG
ncbi:MAG: alpha/beta fold hydrolase [Shewanella sp.]